MSARADGSKVGRRWAVEWRWVSVTASENRQRCESLRRVLLRGARRICAATAPETVKGVLAVIASAREEASA